MNSNAAEDPKPLGRQKRLDKLPRKAGKPAYAKKVSTNALKPIEPAGSERHDPPQLSVCKTKKHCLVPLGAALCLLYSRGCGVGRYPSRREGNRGCRFAGPFCGRLEGASRCGSHSCAGDRSDTHCGHYICTAARQSAYCRSDEACAGAALSQSRHQTDFLYVRRVRPYCFEPRSRVYSRHFRRGHTAFNLWPSSARHAGFQGRPGSQPQ